MFKSTYRVTAEYQVRTLGFIKPKPIVLTVNRIKASKADIPDLIRQYIEQSEDSPIESFTIHSIQKA